MRLSKILILGPWSSNIKLPSMAPDSGKSGAYHPVYHAAEIVELLRAATVDNRRAREMTLALCPAVNKQSTEVSVEYSCIHVLLRAKRAALM